MARYQLGIVSLNRNVHAQCFMEVMRNLAAALRALGHVADYYTPGGQGRLILFGANNLAEDPSAPIPKDTIIYNSEQLAAVKDPRVFMQGYAQQNTFKIWDYSEANIAALKTIGVDNVSLCPIGYVSDKYDHLFRPKRQRVNRLLAEEEDIDVLFYGSIVGRRREVLDALETSGLKAKCLSGIYGEERDYWISRSKVVLNLHFYPNGVFEIFRVSHLVENKRCVVTEAGGCDAGLEDLASRICTYVPREDIVDACWKLVANARMRREQAERAFDEFSKINFVENVRKALEES